HELLQKELTLVPDEAANVDIKMSVLPEYKEQIETRRTKQSLGSIFKTTAIATAVGGAAFLLGAGYYKNKTDDAWALYHDGTDVSEYESLYNDVQDNIDKGQFLQQAAFGLFGVSALSLGFSVYSYMTSPDVPDAQTDLKVEAALVPGGAMMSFTGHF
ncbi:hypothetical protein KAI87_13015, partial [Myxococcota bacterium]|nr:hypothetical protein [Myxococcota bacterium]